MPKKATLKTISDDLKISTSTVSRILNGKAKQFRISEKTVKLVLDYANQVGYAPNFLAKSLRDSKTYTIGLMLPDIANPFFATLAKNIDKAATEANYSILFVNAEDNVEKEKHQVLNLLGRKVDAIIAAPVSNKFSHFNPIIEQNIPLVFIDRYSKETDIPYVSTDNHQGGYDATRLLLENGHKNIALIKGSENLEPAIQRRKGYEHALLDADIKPNSKYILGNAFSIENGYTSTIKLLKLKHPPTAIFASSNLIGLGVLQAVNELGFTIPNDLSLIIFDDQPYVSYLNPPVTTVKQNSEKIGFLTMEYTLNLIEKKTSNLAPALIPPQLIVRKSVRKLN